MSRENNKKNKNIKRRLNQSLLSLTISQSSINDWNCVNQTFIWCLQLHNINETTVTWRQWR